MPLKSIYLTTLKNQNEDETETWLIAVLKINSSKLTAILMSSSIPSFPEYGTFFFSVSNLHKWQVISDTFKIFIGQGNVRKRYNPLFIPTEMTSECVMNLQRVDILLAWIRWLLSSPVTWIHIRFIVRKRRLWMVNVHKNTPKKIILCVTWKENIKIKDTKTTSFCYRPIVHEGLKCRWKKKPFIYLEPTEGCCHQRQRQMRKNQLHFVI